MLTLIICLIIFIAGFIFAVIKHNSDYSILVMAMSIISIWVAGFLVICPWNGYNDWILESEKNLVQLEKDDFAVNDCEDPIYLFLSNNNEYYFCIENVEKVGSYKVRTTSMEVESGDFQYIESDDYEEPILKIYTRSPKSSIWNMPIFVEDESLKVFCVPENGVISEFEINK